MVNAVNSNQYDEISDDEFSDDEISGFANTTKFPTTKFLTTKFLATKFPPPQFLMQGPPCFEVIFQSSIFKLRDVLFCAFCLNDCGNSEKFTATSAADHHYLPLMK